MSGDEEMWFDSGFTGGLPGVCEMKKEVKKDNQVFGMSICKNVGAMYKVRKTDGWVDFEMSYVKN